LVREKRHFFAASNELFTKIFNVGKDSIDFSSVVGEPFDSCFVMSLNKKVFELKRTDEVVNFEETILADEESGADNRDIFDGSAFEKDFECAQKVCYIFETPAQLKFNTEIS